MQARYVAMLLARSGEERLRMATSMFDTVRAIMRARLRAAGCPESELRVAMFLQTYGGDFDDATRQTICAWLRRTEPGQGGAPPGQSP